MDRPAFVGGIADGGSHAIPAARRGVAARRAVVPRSAPLPLPPVPATPVALATPLAGLGSKPPPPPADRYARGPRMPRALPAMRVVSRSRTVPDVLRMRLGIPAVMTGGGGGSGSRGNGGGLGRSGWSYGEDDDAEDGEFGRSAAQAPAVHVLLRQYKDGGAMCEKMALAVGAIGSCLETSAAAFVVNPSAPVVILLSWMGAKSKSMKKYAEFYQSRGFEVHYVFNGFRTALVPNASRAQARRVASFLDAMPDEKPVFVHAFSIGTGIYGYMLDHLKSDVARFEAIQNKVRGVIFDSGPAPMLPSDVARGLHTVCPAVSRAVWATVAHGMFWLTQARENFIHAEDALRQVQFKRPQLYFYSTDDRVVSGINASVQDYIARNRALGLDVYHTIWEKSVHATHLKHHRDEYLSSLQRFLDRCMDAASDAAETAQRQARSILPVPAS
ncbi:hypothetical protein MMPV_000896 [Pyropia vietnamensis]